MAGLLAANLMRHRDPVVVEAQDAIPHNHSAVLRFRTSTVGDALGIPFRRVNVIKTSLPWRNSVADALAYSYKNTGTYSSDRSIVLPEQHTTERWIAPPDLIPRMARRIRIELGVKFDFAFTQSKVISTIPMPDLMTALNYPAERPIFKYFSGTNLRATVNNCDAFVSMLVPDPELPFSRISVTGNEFIVEIAPGRSKYPHSIGEAAELIGIDPSDLIDVKEQVQNYAKIAPIDEHQRKTFIYYASTLQGKAFSLGRYACWRPKLLLDDLINDIRLIDSWIDSGTPGSSVHHDLHYIRGGIKG